MKEVIIDDIPCIIGSNAPENWKILDDAEHNNLFFHLTSFPSCFVILKTEDPNFSDIETIRVCATECKNNTKHKHIPNIKVDYTPCNNVKKGDVLGEIVYKSNRKVKQIKV